MTFLLVALALLLSIFFGPIGFIIGIAITLSILFLLLLAAGDSHEDDEQ